MKRARLGAHILLLSAVTAAAVVAFTAGRHHLSELSERPPAHRPRLLLLTSLPLLFGEGFSLSNSSSPVLKRLETRYRVVPISLSDPRELAQGHVLLIAQPWAQTAENLVALDAWVRSGGRLLLLADPLLEWESDQPLGDLTRPPVAFLDTGLLAHWGLRLDSPDQPGEAERQLGSYAVLTLSPGSLEGGCRITRDRFIAHCRIGKGAATIVADADFLNVGRLGWGGRHNIDGLVAELASLEQS